MVRWRDATDLLVELGISVVVQIAPGHTTAALFASTHGAVPVVAIDGHAIWRLAYTPSKDSPRSVIHGDQ